MLGFLIFFNIAGIIAIILLALFGPDDSGGFDFSMSSLRHGNSRRSTPEHKETSADSDYDSYYEEIHDDAFSGSQDAAEEMQDEFGDGWESEY